MSENAQTSPLKRVWMIDKRHTPLQNNGNPLQNAPSVQDEQRADATETALKSQKNR